MLTTMAGYAVAPAPFTLLTFATVTVGTGLTSAAANAINQVRGHGLSRQALSDSCTFIKFSGFVRAL